MSKVISSATMSKVLSEALKSGLIDENDHSIIFYDLSFFEEKIEELKKSFPENTLHAIAVKANPLPGILKKIQKLNLGLEAASIGEVYLAFKSGFEADKIVFDSPAKTKKDLGLALEHGIHINADSFYELERISALKENVYTNSKIGLRINPQTGEGAIKITSVAGNFSKFGIPIKEAETRIIDSFKKFDWLSGLHFHVGSQGISIEKLVESCRVIIGLAGKIGNAVKWIDIGGGLPVNYSGQDQPSKLKIYTDKLRKQCPQLFDGTYNLITEFGRTIHANAGWTASRIEYVKDYSKKIVIINVGADLFLRESYQSNIWKHFFSVTDKEGHLKHNPPEQITIAGPLCFSGDIIAKDIMLPVVEQDDYLLIHDSGAYNLSMWSRYNSRLVPKVIGYRENGKSFEILKDKETLEDLYNFWS